MYIVDIPPGCARLNCKVDTATGVNTFVLGVSPYKIELRDDGDYSSFAEKLDQEFNSIEWILGIKLSDWRQARGYAEMFSKIADKMKEDEINAAKKEKSSNSASES